MSEVDVSVEVAPAAAASTPEPELEQEPEPEPSAADAGPPLTCREEAGRGWCYRAARALPAGTALLCSAPDIAALYTDHTASCCAGCFARAPEGAPHAQCPGCTRFALCAGCAEGGALRRWHEADECAAFQKIPAVRSPPLPLSMLAGLLAYTAMHTCTHGRQAAYLLMPCTHAARCGQTNNDDHMFNPFD